VFASQATRAVPRGVRRLGLGPAPGRQRQFCRRARRRGALAEARPSASRRGNGADRPQHAAAGRHPGRPRIPGPHRDRRDLLHRRHDRWAAAAGRRRGHPDPHRRQGRNADHAGEDPRGAAQRRQGHHRERVGGEGHAAGPGILYLDAGGLRQPHHQRDGLRRVRRRH
ncbi:hypothetical protein KXV85_005513, partial [Aspergillus fumigatus]